jgi:transcriptional regulator with PAS, ATPase and Fis domain
MNPAWRALFSFDDILGESEALRRAVWLGHRAAESEYSTLLTGESGTGKELFAQAIHNGSTRREAPFVAINSGTLSGELAVAELCGTEPGSFTGAERRTHAGILDTADGGTLFLDELQDMHPGAQSVLLRFLESGAFVRVGATRPTSSNVRVISAMNVGVEEAERREMVRPDLLYRLNCLTIEIPPLRERREDIRPIAEKCLREELHFLGAVDDGLWRALATSPYTWPGNARGLRNILLRTILRSTGGVLKVDDLPTEFWRVRAEPAPPRAGTNGSAPSAEEARALKAVLRATRDNVSETARRLGVHRSTVYRRLARLDKD